MIQPVSRLLVASLLCLALVPTGAAADPCRSENFEGSTYTVCSFDRSESDIRIFWRNAEGAPYASFAALERDLASQGLKLAFAMNGGMYDEALGPVGLYIENGREIKAANTADAAGNFHMKPNGVFYIGDDDVGILETGLFTNVRPETTFATQSGPMLVIKGNIHPRFIPGSEFRKRRDGVGVSSPTEMHFAISDGAVNFDEFARFFRDRLGCKNALFLDGGSAPGLYAPELGRNDSWSQYGPIIAVVE
jgi:uncharacterized protein YigE (DUF2233 family)